jgi:hypothetical protein
MKLNCPRIFLFLTAIVFVAACKKNAQPSPPSVQNLNADSVASQAAVNLISSLNGTYGGANINDGFTVPKATTSANRGLIVNTITPFCGYTIDTAYSTNTTKFDVEFIDKGQFTFVYTCSTTYLDGYRQNDTISNERKNTNVDTIYTLGHHFVVKALDQTYKLVSMNGTSAFSTSKQEVPGKYAQIDVTSIADHYVYEGVTVNFAKGTAVMKGTIKFTSTIHSPLSPTYMIKDAPVVVNKGTTGNFTGTIVFTGDTTYAQINLDNNDGTPGGVSYQVNFLTGNTKVTGKY